MEKKLLSKLQYKNFETGEFTEEKERSLDDVCALIDSFPWEEQRQKIVIGMTNPSVTIQKGDNEFLKLALYYHQQFALYFLDGNGVLYVKSMPAAEDSMEIIREFYQQPSIQPISFKKQRTPFLDVRKHFVSQQFEYRVSIGSAFRFLLATSWLNFGITAMIVSVFVLRNRPADFISAIFILLFVLFFGGGINVLLWWSHYAMVRGKVLKMSKGNNLFLYGNADAPQQFSKSDILEVDIKKLRNTKHSIGEFSIARISMTNGDILFIPNLMLRENKLERKLDGINIAQENGLPIAFKS